MIRSAPGNAFTLKSVGRSGPITFGSNTHVVGNDITSTFTSAAAATGFRTFRDGIDWHDIEITAGAYTFVGWTGNSGGAGKLSKMIAVLDALALIGVTPVLCLSQFKSGAAPIGTFYPGVKPWDNPTPPTYLAAMQAVVTFIGARCNHYEMTNEPQLDMSAAQYAYLCSTLFGAIKAGNPNATVWAGVALSPAANLAYQTAFLAATPDWRLYSDGYTFHNYDGNVNQHSGTTAPEIVAKKARDTMAAVRANRPGCRFAITESGSGTDAPTTQTQMGINAARYIFMCRALDVEFHQQYAMYQYNNGMGLWDGVGVPGAHEPVYRRCYAIVHGAVDARYYQHVPLHAVAMLYADGSRQLAVWGYTGTGDTLTGESDYTGTVTITVNNQSGSTGTLTTTLMSDGTTTTQSCPTGYSQMRVPISGLARVISCNVVVSFEKLPV